MQKKIRINVKGTRLLSDTVTPVSIYLKIRDVFPDSLLLESSDYRGSENSFSFICLKPLAEFRIDNGIITENYPGNVSSKTSLADPEVFKQCFNRFVSAFETNEEGEVPVNGLFGYIAYDAVRYFEKIDLFSESDSLREIPDVRYTFFRYIIAVNHFQNVLHIVENIPEGEKGDSDRIISLINSRNIAVYPFKVAGDEESSATDEEYMRLVTKGKEHCYRGDVFQVVMSRQFSRRFTGDEFNVYRSLRSINPSPYLFYFDYGGYRIFGSSPEAHLKVNRNKAYINPIAGTFRRTGNEEQDRLLAARLAEDTKENSEHVMLVDLARNDLSRYASNVKVESLREIQFYSHVIHLVSSVSGEIAGEAAIADLIVSTFPAGTLTGAPKFRAMELIDRYEGRKRGYYGGALGFIDFKGRFNHAIMIRTFLSMAGRLHYQAGAGIVAVSDEETELQEVNNKLGALRTAITNAETIK